MMKIGFDAKRLFLNDTGLGNYSRTLVKNLHQHYPEHQYFLFTPSIRENRETSFFINHPDFKIITPPHKLSWWWRSKGMVSDIVNSNLDIYHGLSHELPFGLQKTHVKTVVTIHDLIFEKFPQYYPAVDRYMYRWKYRYASRTADRVIAISEHTRKDLSQVWKIPANKIDVVYQSCNEQYFNTPVKSREKQHFLYVGAITPRKGLLDIIEAYRGLVPDHPFPLVVIGEGGKHSLEVKKRVQEYGLENRVIFKGSLSNTEILQYYDRAVALIYPSYYEGFGIPIVEAALRKVPVICSNAASMPEAGGPDVTYIDPGDISKLRAYMQQIINYPEIFSKSTENTYIYCSKSFSAENTARSLLKVYLEIFR